MIDTFKDFIIGTNYFTYKGKVYMLNKNNQNEKISNAYFNIDYIELYNSNGLNYEFTVGVDWKGMGKTNDIQSDFVIEMSKNYNLYYSDLKKEIQENCICQDGFLKLCEDYLKYVLMREIKKCKSAPFIGWVIEGDMRKVYFGVSRDVERYSVNFKYPFLFNDDIINLKDNNFSDLIQWILSNENLLGIFAYTIHSFFYYFGGGGKGIDYKDEVFSICVYGKDIKKLNVIANLLCNVFEYDKLESLKSGSFISCSSLKKINPMLFRIESVPYIVKNKNYKITKTTSIVGTFHRYQECGKIGFFPVYLSQNAINADEIKDFCLNDIVLKNNYNDLKKQINNLLFKFVLFLTELEIKRPENAACEHNMDRLYRNIIDKFQRDGVYSLTEKRADIMLYIACMGFKEFLMNKLELYALANELSKKAKSLFLEESTIYFKKGSSNGMTSFIKFIKYILSQEGIKKGFICTEQVETRGGEDCIYIDYPKGYKEYQLYCKEQNLDCLDYNYLLKKMKEDNLIKMRSNKQQYFLKRTLSFNGKKVSRDVLVIYRESFFMLDSLKKD